MSVAYSNVWRFGLAGHFSIVIYRYPVIHNIPYNKKWPNKTGAFIWVRILINLHRLFDLSNCGIINFINGYDSNYIRLDIRVSYYRNNVTEDVLEKLNLGLQNLHNIAELSLYGNTTYNAKWLPKSVIYLHTSLTNAVGCLKIKDIGHFKDLDTFYCCDKTELIDDMNIPGIRVVLDHGNRYKLSDFNASDCSSDGHDIVPYITGDSLVDLKSDHIQTPRYAPHTKYKWTFNEYEFLEIKIIQYSKIDNGPYNKNWPNKTGAYICVDVYVELNIPRDLSKYRLADIINGYDSHYKRLEIYIKYPDKEVDILETLKLDFRNLQNIAELNISGGVTYDAKWLPKSVIYLEVNHCSDFTTVKDIGYFNNLDTYTNMGCTTTLIGDMYIPGIRKINNSGYKLSDFRKPSSSKADPVTIDITNRLQGLESNKTQKSPQLTGKYVLQNKCDNKQLKDSREDTALCVDHIDKVIKQLSQTIASNNSELADNINNRVNNIVQRIDSNKTVFESRFDDIMTQIDSNKAAIMTMRSSLNDCHVHLESIKQLNTQLGHSQQVQRKKMVQLIGIMHRQQNDYMRRVWYLILCIIVVIVIIVL